MTAGTASAPVACPHPQGDVPWPAQAQMDAFSAQVLTDVGAPATPGNEQVMRMWARGEDNASRWGGGALARHNPLNSTSWTVGAWTFNRVGVRVYPSAAVGESMTAATLEDGHYPQLLAGFRTAMPLTWWQASAEVHAEFDEWGTHTGWLCG